MLTILLMIGYFPVVWPRGTLAFCPQFQSLAEIFDSGILRLKKDLKGSFATHLWTAHLEEVYTVMDNTVLCLHIGCGECLPFPLWKKVALQDILQVSFTNQWQLWEIIQIHVLVELKQNPLGFLFSC